MSLSRLSVELIPRSAEALAADVATVKAAFPAADTLNIPDLMRFPLRSWDAAALVRPQFGNVIPHIRAIDIAPDAPLPGADQPGLEEILVVHGDPPADLSHRTYPNSTESIIRRYRREAPHLKVYAAFDPYRRAPWKELEDVARKKEAGAIGFFTQPVFDLKLFDLCREWMQGECVFWGLSPVIGPKSRSYWETTNHIVFPRDFSPTLDANIQFAQTVLKELAQEKGKAYLMPVRIKLEQYLPALLDAVA
ncbi:methylenetetrahydrofolate reductase [Acetobacter pasteurianus]|uniref:5,10-methylenetetrahydrofolate reductase n=4 Tax=Acetobacter pasteurianus TaxID=438 RepID=C7JBE9_ACEP3|nr:methylenetetrahydrofolate reductase [Acetobacter pasteurianus]BAU37287.1 5,10-methylenetetrahydrofolate reductase [Acetobacter pasteurianus NBRC 101655]ASC05385.1 Methylenetetrahydrofolate reductase (NAD(P)H) [Acetobacter pasteurianus subsp. pasteurianus]OAZ73225.1 Methylenetetrahydrofolate reductase (NAD(P)H) [Acetobacter pasteurianus]CCT59786.1 methylenetetrahydrofolate reductase (NADPH) [Acetobacter pasteurianus 386B]BAH98376.1 5,10-methylenetetrahydrofolate reductase [Acetobacter pasteu